MIERINFSLDSIGVVVFAFRTGFAAIKNTSLKASQADESNLTSNYDSPVILYQTRAIRAARMYRITQKLTFIKTISG